MTQINHNMSAISLGILDLHEIDNSQNCSITHHVSRMTTMGRRRAFRNSRRPTKLTSAVRSSQRSVESHISKH